jgi:hypothetical protein
MPEESVVHEERLPRPPAWLQRDVVEPLADIGDPDEQRSEHPYRMARGLKSVALVIDLPGARSTDMGVHFAEHGFRPIPLYNAVPSDVAVVDMQPIIDVLADAAERVARAPAAAPPAFLLDANRMGAGRVVRPGLFDNRSTCRMSDFPSVEMLRRMGVRRVAVICERPAADLESVLHEWQAGGIALWLKRTGDDRKIAPFVLERRSWLFRLGNVIRRAGLHRRADGSYGKLIEPPASS